MLRICLTVLLYSFAMSSFAQANLTMEDVRSMLKGGSFIVEKQCRDYGGCLSGDSTEYYYVEEHACVNDSCIYFVMRFYGYKAYQSGEYEIRVTPHNSIFKIAGKKTGTNDVFEIDYYHGDGISDKAHLKIISRKTFMIYGRVNDNFTSYLYYKRASLPLELVEHINSNNLK